MMSMIQSLHKEVTLEEVEEDPQEDGQDQPIQGQALWSSPRSGGPTTAVRLDTH